MSAKRTPAPNRKRTVWEALHGVSGDPSLAPQDIEVAVQLAMRHSDSELATPYEEGRMQRYMAALIVSVCMPGVDIHAYAEYQNADWWLRQPPEKTRWFNMAAVRATHSTFAVRAAPYSDIVRGISAWQSEYTDTYYMPADPTELSDEPPLKHNHVALHQLLEDTKGHPAMQALDEARKCIDQALGITTQSPQPRDENPFTKHTNPLAHDAVVYGSHLVAYIVAAPQP